MAEFPKIKLPKGSRTFSGEHLMDRHGGEMWDDLRKWFEEQLPIQSLRWKPSDILEKIKQIEKEYGITYVE